MYVFSSLRRKEHVTQRESVFYYLDRKFGWYRGAFRPMCFYKHMGFFNENFSMKNFSQKNYERKREYEREAGTD